MNCRSYGRTTVGRASACPFDAVDGDYCTYHGKLRAGLFDTEPATVRQRKDQATPQVVLDRIRAEWDL